MPSLQVRHSRQCAKGRVWTTADQPALDGTDGKPACTCPGGPSFVVSIRQGRKHDRKVVGRNRREADRALRKLGVAVDEGTYQPVRRITVADWGTQWLAGLQTKPSTADSYGGSVRILTRAIGHKLVRDVRPDDVRAILAGMDKLAGARRPGTAAPGACCSSRRGSRATPAATRCAA